MPKGLFRAVEERETLSQESMIILEAVEFVKKNLWLRKSGNCVAITKQWLARMCCLFVIL